MLPTKNLQQTVADSQQRLVSLVNLFHTTNAVFCQAFGSTEHSPYRQGTGDWKLFNVMLSNYRQHRWDEKGGLCSGASKNHIGPARSAFSVEHSQA